MKEVYNFYGQEYISFIKDLNTMLDANEVTIVGYF